MLTSVCMSGETVSNIKDSACIAACLALLQKVIVPVSQIPPYRSFNLGTL